LTFAREAGGAQAIAPVIKELLSKGSDVLISAKGVGIAVFEGHGFTTSFLEVGDGFCIESLLRKTWHGKPPDIVLTSCASLPELDMTEKRLWKWARANGIESIAVLDQWQNYAKRFSSAGTSDLAFLPDVCCVMNELAKKGMIEDGFPLERIVITGQPAFDKLIQVSGAEADAVLLLKKDLTMDNGRPTLVFVGEALGRHFEGIYGYDERQCLNALLDIIKMLPERPNLIVKKHPQNLDSDFDLDAIELVSDKLVVKIVGTEQSAKTVILASDIVVGMSSVLLVESIILGVPTVSVELGAKVFDKCFPVTIGAIPAIVTKEKARLLLSRLISDKESRAEWIVNQSILGHIEGATKNVAELLVARTNV
jgi:hypothetical protein